jgi:signal transduction histidine kinase
MERLAELESRVFISEEEFSAGLDGQIRQTAALTVLCCVALFVLFAVENHRVAGRRRAAERASEVKSAFLASMSHELRTPLKRDHRLRANAAGGGASRGPADDLVDLQRIEAAGQHLLTLINGVLELSKIEAGRMEVTPVEFGVEEVVREVMGLVEPLASLAGELADGGRGAGRGPDVQRCDAHSAGAVESGWERGEVYAGRGDPAAGSPRAAARAGVGGLCGGGYRARDWAGGSGAAV